jgi:hypothetical protein
METLRQAWAEYEHEVLPECFSQGSRDVVQHAFYHGAVALLMIGHTYRQRGATEAQRAEMMCGIIDEIHEFNAGCEVKMLLHVLGEALRG